jgi:excisionase family DNA binding protein
MTRTHLLGTTASTAGLALTSPAIPADAGGKLAHSVENAAARLDCGRTTIYALLQAGRLRAVKLNGRTLVLESSLRELLSGLPTIGRAA